MPRSARRRRVRPYAWLGTGVVTLGLGAAVIAGTAVAAADTAADGRADAGPSAGDTAATSTSASADPSSTATPAAQTPPQQVAPEAAAGDESAATRKAAATRGSRGSAPAANVEKTRENLPVSRVRVTAPAAAASQPAQAAVPPVSSAAADPVASPAAAAPLPAAAPPPPGPDPSYNMNSYLPVTPIVPGARVQLALQQITDAQNELSQEVMNSGNVIAALVAIGPQLLLAQSAWTLNAWQDSMPTATQWVADSANIPIVHQVSQLNLLATMTLPTLSDAGLVGAALLLPLVNLLGVATSATQSLVGQARSNGQVYAWLPVQMKATTQPTISIAVNGGSRVPVLVDTGASGLIVTPDVLGPGSLGSPIGSGNSCFSGGLCYHYETYNAVVDFGGAAVTSPTPVNVVTNNAAYPNSVADFKEFLSWGADGVLGTGANAAGPGPVGLPTTALPGELNNGFLLYQGAFLGLFGVMVLGPNPLPVRVSVPGTPDSYVRVSVNDSPQQYAYAIIDSGGVYGTIPAYLVGGQSSGLVPSGTKISVYTSDGQTLLWSWTTSGQKSPTAVPDGELFNTSVTPFQQGPIYLNYAAPDRIGSTDFAIW